MPLIHFVRRWAEQKESRNNTIPSSFWKRRCWQCHILCRGTKRIWCGIDSNKIARTSGWYFFWKPNR
jgi:hypothetical protein